MRRTSNTRRNGDDTMDIPALSMAMAQTSLQTDISTAVLSKAMDTTTDLSDGLTKMMELSVNPEIGGNLDLSL